MIIRRRREPSGCNSSLLGHGFIRSAIAITGPVRDRMQQAQVTLSAAVECRRPWCPGCPGFLHRDALPVNPRALASQQYGRTPRSLFLASVPFPVLLARHCHDLSPCHSKSPRYFQQCCWQCKWLAARAAQDHVSLPSVVSSRDQQDVCLDSCCVRFLAPVQSDTPVTRQAPNGPSVCQPIDFFNALRFKGQRRRRQSLSRPNTASFFVSSIILP
jgi:hypothetical protein